MNEGMTTAREDNSKECAMDDNQREYNGKRGQFD